MIVDGLASKLDVASILALRVSAQVQQLDQQRERVSSALVATSNLLHLRSCAANVESALARADVRDAALQVERFRTSMSSDPGTKKKILLEKGSTYVFYFFYFL